MTVEVAAAPVGAPKTFLRRLPADLIAFALGYMVLLPLFLAPLFVTHFLPGLDLPFHLALADMLAQLPTGAGPYPVAYEGGLHFSPYALHYWALLGASGLISLNLANKLLMAVYVAVLPLSLCRLLATCGRSRLPALLAFPLTYNLSFFYGFASYLLSLPILFLLLAQVADNTDVFHEDDDRAVQGALLRDLALAALGVLLFLSHLATFLFGMGAALLVIGFAGAPLTYRIRTTLTLLPGGAALGYWQASAVGNAMPDRPLWIVANSVLHARVQELSKLSLSAVADDLWGRLLAVPQHLMLGFRDGIHLQAALLCGAALATYFAFGVVGIFARGGDRSQGRLSKGGVMLLLATTVAYLGLPHHLPKLGMMTVYPRLAVIMALFGTLLIPPWLKRYPRWMLPVLVLPGLGASGWYGVELTRHFDRYGQEQQEFAKILDKTPPGGKLLGLVFDRESKVLGVSGALVGLPSYYPVERPGAGGMVAQIYCDMDHMPCRTKDTQTLPPAPSPWEPQKLQPERAVPYFSLFLVRGGPKPDKLFAPFADAIETVATEGSWVLYRRKEGVALPALDKTRKPGEGDKGKEPKEPGADADAARKAGAGEAGGKPGAKAGGKPGAKAGGKGPKRRPR